MQRTVSAILLAIFTLSHHAILAGEPPSLGSIVRPRKLTLLALSFDREASRSEGLAGSADQVQLPTNSVKHTARKLQLIGDRMIDLLTWRQ